MSTGPTTIADILAAIGPLRLKPMAFAVPKLRPMRLDPAFFQFKWYAPTQWMPMMPLYLDGVGYAGQAAERPTGRKRASKGWRKHVRRMKAAERRSSCRDS